MLRRSLVLLLTVVAVLAALSGPAATVFAQDAPQAVLDALAALNARLGTNLALSNMASWSWEQNNFPDTSLGCPQTGFAYSQVVTNGYIVLLVYNGVQYDYRVSANRQTIFLCTDTSGAPGGTPGQPGSATSTAIPSPTPLPVALPTATIPVATGSIVCAGGLPTRLAVGMQAHSVTTSSINIRNPPSLTDPSAVSGLLLPGGSFTVVDGPRCVDNRTWWQIEYASAVGLTRGWVIEGDNVDYWLAPVGGAVSVPPGQTQPGGSMVISAANAARLALTVQAPLLQNAVGAALLSSGDALIIDATGSLHFYRGATHADLNLALSHPGQTVVRVAAGPKDAFTVRYATLERSVSAPTMTLLYLSEITTGNTVPTVAEKFGVQLPFQPNSLVFSPDGQVLAISSGDLTGTTSAPNVVFLWDTATGTQLAPITLDGPAADLAFSHDNNLLAISVPNSGVGLWSRPSGAERARLPGASGSQGTPSMAFSPDGSLLVVGTDDGQIVLWDVTTATPRHMIQSVSGGQVRFVTFSPDGTLFVTASVMPTQPGINAGFAVWETATGNRLVQPASMTDATVTLGFSADGQALVNIGTTTWWAWTTN